MRNISIVGLFALLFASGMSAQDVYRVSDQVTAPTIVTRPRAIYTTEARRKGVKGVVELEVDVMADGRVGTVALVKSLDPELDKLATEAAKKARFTPGMKDGKPVTVRVPLSLTYSYERMTFQGTDEADLPGKTALPK